MTIQNKDLSMKKYDVYAIGNALVDMEIKVSEQFLTKQNIDKGLMSLIDEVRRDELIGEFSADQIHRACGGSAANTVIAVSQFGGKAFYSCKVASDDNGHFYLADMKENGVDINLDPQNLPVGKTGTCLVMITEDAQRSMNTFLGITSEFSVNEVRADILSQSEYLYIEGYLVASPTGQEAAMLAAKTARENKVPIALTFSDPNMVNFFRSNFNDIINGGVDLIFGNEAEVMAFANTQDLKEAAEYLKRFAKTFVITQGSNGALIFDGDTFIDIAPYPVKAVDTNGAGDMFAGAFLYGITSGHSYASSGKLASLASSRVVGQYGPRLKWTEAKDVHHQLFDR